MKPKFMNIGFKYSPDNASGAPTGEDATPSTETTSKQPESKQPNDQESLYLKEIERFKRENESLKKAQKEREEKEALKKGEFEKLYLQQKEEKEALQAQYKKDKLKSIVTLEAKDLGLKNKDFIKLFDTDSLEMDDDGNVIGLTEELTKFKDKFPELFSDGGTNKKEDSEKEEKKVPFTDNARKSFTRGVDTNDIDTLSKMIRDPKTGTRQREKAIAKRLTLQLKQK